MKSIILSSLLVLAGVVAFSQTVPNPVIWTYGTKKINSGYEVHMTATIGDGYRIYSQNPGGNIKPLAFVFDNNTSLTVKRPIKEIGILITGQHGIWKIKNRYYQKSVDFVVKVKLKGTSPTTLNGKIIYVLGNDTNNGAEQETSFSVWVGRE